MKLRPTQLADARTLPTELKAFMRAHWWWAKDEGGPAGPSFCYLGQDNKYWVVEYRGSSPIDGARARDKHIGPFRTKKAALAASCLLNSQAE